MVRLVGTFIARTYSQIYHQLYDNDPVRTLKLSTYVRDRLQEAEAMYGSEVFRTRFLAPADPTVLQQIEKELASA